MAGLAPSWKGLSALSHRQVLASALAALFGMTVACRWLVPDLQRRVGSGALPAGQAIDAAAASTAGLMLFCLASTLLACTLYNRLARELARRRQAGARQTMFLTSLGHCLSGPRLSSDRKSQD